MEQSDLVRSYRIGPRKEAHRSTRSSTSKKTSRPIIFRCISWNKRLNVFKNKRKLKSKNISLTDSRTSSHLDRYTLAIVKYGYVNVWTPGRTNSHQNEWEISGRNLRCTITINAWVNLCFDVGLLLVVLFYYKLPSYRVACMVGSMSYFTIFR